MRGVQAEIRGGVFLRQPMVYDRKGWNVSCGREVARSKKGLHEPLKVSVDGATRVRGT